VLKACNDPYISFHTDSHFIKLKKDYIVGLVDDVDLAIVGGSRDVRDEPSLGMGKLS
jgi:hypothetical protein